MPKMDGVEATRRIMSESPCAIVVVTASIEGNVSKVFEAMGAGALDAVNTPILGGAGSPNGTNALLGKIETIRKLVGASVGQKPALPRHLNFINGKTERAQLVAIGASAGGPAALAKVLAPLPRDFPAAIVIVQHVDSQFAPGLASWLDHQTELTVRVAEEGDHPTPGVALLAGLAMVVVGAQTFMGGRVSELLPANMGSDGPLGYCGNTRIIDGPSIALTFAGFTSALVGGPIVCAAALLLVAPPTTKTRKEQ